MQNAPPPPLAPTPSPPPTPPLAGIMREPRSARGAYYNQRWALVVPILFLDFLVVSLPGGVLPVIINDEFGARSYSLVGWAQTTKGVLAFLTSPALGSCSDAVGRKWLFLLTVLGTACPNAALGLGFSLEVHLVLVGLSGLFAATFPLAFAYIADSVPPHERASAYGVAIGCGLGGAYLIGPPIGAVVNERYGSHAVFQVCLWISIVNALFATLAMRETDRPPPPPMRELLRRANPFGSFAMIRTNKAMRLLAAVVLCFYLALWGFLSNKGVYARRRFKLSVPQTAAQLALFGLVSTISQSVGLRLARKWLSEPQIARRCFACAVMSQLLYAFASDLWVLYPAMALLGLSVGGFATVSSLCSQVVPHALVGEAQGVLASMKALMEGFGPMAFAWMLPRWEESVLPGAPWLVSAALMSGAFVLCLWLEAYTDEAVHTHRCESPDAEESTSMLWPPSVTLSGKEESASMHRRGSGFSLNGHPTVAQHGAGQAGHVELDSVNEEEDGSDAAPDMTRGGSCNEPAVDTPKAHLAKRPVSAPSTAR
ncbi:hippocampus abundant transcript 1 protein [Chrysochromulina tobinii]|uniref:Hippocampus abundant transcript 1 protein n=1 Tax=Chrysochromulina tobinii TaxID=1460289 RepID=A0A0M0K1C9_9EUKA|nr:hippocampus abundant transcript 1 protein [Chrysochromulina tobinii]|eukprot:KOO32609.1 hippocampus abundant transcript 1 protein [Chrysochromulina sp. CCMP291]